MVGSHTAFPYNPATSSAPAHHASHYHRHKYSLLSGFFNSLRSEFCKIRTVRSTFWTLFLAAVFNVALAATAAIVLPSRLSAQERMTIDSVRLSLAGLHLSQIAFGVLGVLVITSEYGTGMIRASLAAVPQRQMMLLTKSLVLTITALVAGVVSCFAAYYVFQLFLSGNSMSSSIKDAGVFRAVFGGGLFLTVLGLLGLGLGIIIRASAGTIAALFALMFVPPILINLLPHSWQTTLGPYLPMNAGEQIYIVHHEAGQLQPWTGFGVFCIYAGAALVIGFFLINRRDA